MYLPSSDVEIERTLERSGIHRKDDYEMHIEDNRLCVDLEDVLNEVGDVYALNKMRRIAEQGAKELNKITARVRVAENHESESSKQLRVFQTRNNNARDSLLTNAEKKPRKKQIELPVYFIYYQSAFFWQFLQCAHMIL